MNLNNYQDFVENVTSEPSNNLDILVTRLEELDKIVNISLLLTGSTGLASEGGEFAEIVKKCMFQGKPLTEDTIFHLKRELGDIIFYWVNSCRALGLDPNDVINENINKLSARYPGGFSVEHSENRKENDL